MIAWHFLQSDGRLRDGIEAPADGEWLEHNGQVKICESGLHYSERLIDALNYAIMSDICTLVEVEDIVEVQSDKGVCRRRKIIFRRNIKKELGYFARWCALSVIHLWDAPDVVKRFLKTGDESLRKDAHEAAWAAARAAAAAARAAASTDVWPAARAAARAAASTDVWPAARAAARAAASTDVWPAARAAASTDAWADQNDFLEFLILTSHEIDQRRKGG